MRFQAILFVYRFYYFLMHLSPFTSFATFWTATFAHWHIVHFLLLFGTYWSRSWFFVSWTKKLNFRERKIWHQWRLFIWIMLMKHNFLYWIQNMIFLDNFSLDCNWSINFNLFTYCIFDFFLKIWSNALNVN